MGIKAYNKNAHVFARWNYEQRMDFGDRLKSEREKLRQSKQQISAMCGLRVSDITKIENGQIATMDQRLVLAYIRTLGLRPADVGVGQ